MISRALIDSVAIPYTIGFALLAFLPGWRSLGLLSLAAFSLCLWAFFDVSHADGPGGIFAIVMIGSASLGFFAGFVARTTVLLGYDMSWKYTHPGLVLPVAFVGVIGCFIALAALQSRWDRIRRAPPSIACLEALHAAKLGDIDLALPLAPNIRVGLGWEFSPSYIFKINTHARDFCDLASSGPVELTNISLDFTRRSPIDLSQRYRDLCSRHPPSAWRSAVCSKDSAGTLPVKMTAYASEKYNAARMHAQSSSSASDYRQRMAGLPVAELEDGVRMHTGEHDIYFTRANAPEYAARCHPTKPGQTGYELYCSTGFELTPDLGMIYDFRASEKGFEQRSASVDRMAREIFDSLRAR